MGSFTFVFCLEPKLKWSIGRTNCLYHSSRLDMYSNQILLSGDKIEHGDEFMYTSIMPMDMNTNMNTLLPLVQTTGTSTLHAPR